MIQLINGCITCAERKENLPSNSWRTWHIVVDTSAVFLPSVGLAFPVTSEPCVSLIWVKR